METITRQTPSDLFQTIGQIFNPNNAREIVMKCTEKQTTPQVEDAEYKEIKPVTITDDMYMRMAGNILENIVVEREVQTGGEGFFELKNQSFNVDDIEVQYEAFGCIYFRNSYEEWGKERNITSASIILADCQTYDADGDRTDNDFSIQKLESYLKP